MVIRYLIHCNTCQTPMTLRIWVGHNPTQHHAFLCCGCHEEVAVKMDVDLENVSTSVSCLENCSEGNEEGEVVNLNPHFVYDASEEGTDLSFPWMEQARYIQKHSGLEPPDLPKGDAGPIIVDSYEMLGGITNITELWKTARRAWSLQRNGQVELSTQVLEQYQPPGFKSGRTLPDVLFDFCSRLLIPVKIELFKDGMSLVQQLSKIAEDQVQEFRQYYLDNLQEDHLERYFSIFDEYFRDYTEYDQTILYVKNRAPVPDGCIATSSGFRRTRMFYGNAYELYTSNLDVLACLNNISAGRPFDQFETMNLAKYQTINKARRGDPFAANGAIAPFLACLDSRYRNASHHGAAILRNHNRTIEYRSGGTGAKHSISYSRYLEMCGEIALSAAALLMIELMIAA